MAVVLGLLLRRDRLAAVRPGAVAIFGVFERYEDAEEEHHIPSLLPMLIDASMRDPELQALVTEMLDERRRPLRTVLQLAQLRGEIREDIDLSRHMDDAVQSLRICLAADESVRTGQTVKL